MQRHDDDTLGHMGQTSSGGSPLLGLLVAAAFTGFLAILAWLGMIASDLDWTAWLGMVLL
ncbi:hypothetical protein [Mangrovicoccus ximenensis]|uniref:hypothetical protein n=1 Tax=Mangrovicoccus ximenensis TaxID=1911570 RepID=UPI000D3647A5|nr:hypothetical protein [Mangrovicoccus ximenensis]